MLYLKLVVNEFENASHDKRELSAVESLGYKTLVIATTKNASNYLDFYDGYDVYRISTRRLGKSTWLTPLNRIIAFFNFVKKAIQTEAVIVSGHDYIATLAAYIANCFKRHKAKLVYDSHEFELYQDPTRSRWTLWVIKHIEGFLIRRVDLSLMVGDKIADGVQEIYQLETRPTVVRNIAPYWNLEIEKISQIRKEFLQELGLTEHGWIMMYHGAIMAGRGIEFAIQLLSSESDVGLVVMGHESEIGMIEKLKDLAISIGVEERVFFKPSVPIEALKNYIGAVDLEMALLEGRYCKNYAYSLPNKLFESIQACVPIVCFDLPEMGKLVKQYDIGIVVSENDKKSIAEEVLKLRKDKDRYARLKRNIKKAKEEFCWERESERLKAAINEMMGTDKEQNLESGVH